MWLHGLIFRSLQVIFLYAEVWEPQILSHSLRGWNHFTGSSWIKDQCRKYVCETVSEKWKQWNLIFMYIPKIKIDSNTFNIHSIQKIICYRSYSGSERTKHNSEWWQRHSATHGLLGDPLLQRASDVSRISALRWESKHYHLNVWNT